MSDKLANKPEFVDMISEATKQSRRSNQTAHGRPAAVGAGQGNLAAQPSLGADGAVAAENITPWKIKPWKFKDWGFGS